MKAKIKSNAKKKSIKLKDKLENVKSDYFLEKIYNNIQKKKSLEIVKYNNNIKQRLNLNINDFKKYSETHSSIEIEITTDIIGYGQFININDNNKLY